MSQFLQLVSNYLINAFFTPLPSLNNQTGWSILATTLSIPIGNVTTHIDPMDLSGVTNNNGYSGGIEFYDFSHGSDCHYDPFGPDFHIGCAGAGVQIKLGTLNGLAGAVLNPKQPINTIVSGSNFVFTVPVIIPKVNMRGAQMDEGAAAEPTCECKDTANSFLWWLGWGDIPNSILKSDVPSTGTITITIPWFVNPNNPNSVVIDFTNSSFVVTNLSIGLFDNWCYDGVLPGIPCIPVSDLNSIIGNEVEGVIPTDIFSSVGQITLTLPSQQTMIQKMNNTYGMMQKPMSHMQRPPHIYPVMKNLKQASYNIDIGSSYTSMFNAYKK